MSETLHTDNCTDTDNENETSSRGGPRTQAGKAASSKNSFKHGLASGRILIEGEDPAEFEALVADLEADYQPATETEALLVHDLAKFHWLADRAIRLQAEAFAASAWPEMPASLNVLIRYQTTNQRAFQTTLKSLQALQKERKLAEQTDAGSKTKTTDQFVSQPADTGADDLPAGPPEGYFDGRALQALYYAEMNALEEQERKEANERYLEKLKKEMQMEVEQSLPPTDAV
jgi:hypothetical protein